MISFFSKAINDDDDEDDDDDDDDEGWVGRGVGLWVLIYLTYRVCQNQCDCL